MSDSLEPNVSVGASRTKVSRRRAAEPPRSAKQALPEWVPFAVLSVLLFAGALGSRAMRAVSSEANKTSSETAAPSRAAAPAPAPKTPDVAATASAATKDGELRISTQHLVVTHGESIMGRSLNITRTREQAKARSTEALAKARQGADFRQLIEEYSDDAHKNEFHGEQLNFSRKDAIPSFSQAAFALKVGEISNLVDTPFGYMVIRRIK